ncbi:MAG: hypothetical protein LBK77_05945 [Spirochaetaceae bacterium]|nr:hypothetical protein [Spirochaetaceae bacterium]
MKKKLLLVCIVGLLAVNAFADHPSSRLGLGLFMGGGYGSVGGGLFNPGLTLKVPGVPVFWGINVAIGSVVGLSVSGDYYFFDADLIKAGAFDLDWFLGLGGFGHLYFGDAFSFALGARVPIGLSWHINRTFEIFADVAPGIGVTFSSRPLYWTMAGELGLRVWL